MEEENNNLVTHDVLEKRLERFSEGSMYENKEVAYYAATVDAWLQSKFEKDKQLLTLSVAAIGLLVTLATTVGSNSFYVAIVFLIAISCFLVCLFSVLKIFDENTIYLEKIVSKQEITQDKLIVLDNRANNSFILGIVFLILTGIFISHEKYTNVPVALNGVSSEQTKSTEASRTSKEIIKRKETDELTKR